MEFKDQPFMEGNLKINGLARKLPPRPPKKLDNVPNAHEAAPPMQGMARGRSQPQFRRRDSLSASTNSSMSSDAPVYSQEDSTYLLYGYAGAVSNFKDVQRMDGQLLPLLSEWIGWQLDLKGELDEQRNEITRAPTLYKTIGIIPTIQHTVKRISRWESNTKEFVHNVFLSNRPERLNLWQLIRNSSGDWTPQAELFSMDYAYEGRPSFSFDDQQLRWFFYHTQQNGQWEIWYKTTPSFVLDTGLLEHLQVGDVSEPIRQAFQQADFDLADINLSDNTTVSQTGSLWQVNDMDNAQTYLITPEPTGLTVFYLSAEATQFAPSKPLIRNNHINKYPSVALHGNTLWLFWSEYDTSDQQWRIHYRMRMDGNWTAANPDDSSSPFRDAGLVDMSIPRYKPNAVVDRNGNLWLFWLQRGLHGWQIKYNRHDGAGWEATAETLPAGGSGDFRVDSDPWVTMAQSASGPQIYLFWSRQQAATSSNQSRWHVDMQVKTDLNFDNSNWHGVYTLPKDPLDPDYHDREPMAAINSTGDIELFYSTSYQGNWAIWRRTLTTIDTGTNTVIWSEAERLTDSPYSYRDPLALIMSDGRTMLLSRSNESIVRTSDTYLAMQTLDTRYAGCTTQHTRNQPKRSLRQAYEDFDTYTFDTGPGGERSDQDWYARDTVGIYVQADSLDDEHIQNEITRLRNVVTEFIPATDRAVYIAETDNHTEYVYTYGHPPSAESRYIVSTYQDDLSASIEEGVLSPETDFTDTLL